MLELQVALMYRDPNGAPITQTHLLCNQHEEAHSDSLSCWCSRLSKFVMKEEEGFDLRRESEMVIGRLFPFC
jgi:hypothetical protein